MPNTTKGATLQTIMSDGFWIHWHENAELIMPNGSMIVVKNGCPRWDWVNKSRRDARLFTEDDIDE